MLQYSHLHCEKVQFAATNCFFVFCSDFLRATVLLFKVKGRTERSTTLIYPLSLPDFPSQPQFLSMNKKNRLEFFYVYIFIYIRKSNLFLFRFHLKFHFSYIFHCTLMAFVLFADMN